MPGKQSFGDRLADLREERKMSQQAVGDLIKVSRSAVNGYEKGKSYPVADKLLVLAKHFGVSVDYLLTGEQPVVESKPHVVRAPSASPIGASGIGISPELLRGDAQGPADQPGFSYGVPAKPKPAGLDLVERVEQHSSDIKQLQAALSKIQKQLNN